MTSLLKARLGSVPARSLSVSRRASFFAPPCHQAGLLVVCSNAQLGLLSRQPVRKSLLCAARAATAYSMTTTRVRENILRWVGQPIQRLPRVRSADDLRALGAASCALTREETNRTVPPGAAQKPAQDTHPAVPQHLLAERLQPMQKQSFTTTANPSLAARPAATQQKKTAKDHRQALIDSCPLTPVDELVVAAHMARLSNICYVPEPQEQLEALGLKLVAKGKTYFTAWYVADGPNLSKVQEKAPLAGSEAQDLNAQVREGEAKLTERGGASETGVGASLEGGQSSGGRVRYILTHGVRWGAKDLDSGRMWRQIMKCWPVTFPPSNAKEKSQEPGLRGKGSAETMLQEGLVAHQGVLEIAEEVYNGVRPWLAGVEKGEVSAIRFGGHSLGGSVAVLLMLLAKARHGLAPGQVSAHSFGAPAFIARRSVAQKEGEAAHAASQARPALSSNGASTFPFQSPPLVPGQTEQTHSRVNGFSPPTNAGQGDAKHCPVLEVMGLPADAVRSVVLDKDMVPRMFLAADPSYGLLLKSPLVRGLLEWRERVWGPGVLTQDRFLFENVGLVHHIKTVGSEVLVRTLTSEQANEGLRLAVDDFVRQPLDAVKALFDHHRGHYSQDLEAAAAAARYRSRQQEVNGSCRTTKRG